jgi:hypothetical protein
VKGLKKEGATHKLENFDKKDLEPLLNHIGDASVTAYRAQSRCYYKMPRRIIVSTDAYKNLTIS